MWHVKTSYEKLSVDVIAIARHFQRPGEDVIATLVRLAVHKSLEMADGKQAEASKTLRITTRRMNYLCEDLQLRPTDQMEANNVTTN